jgi:hypothetical protein
VAETGDEPDALAVPGARDAWELGAIEACARGQALPVARPCQWPDLANGRTQDRPAPVRRSPGPAPLHRGRRHTPIQVEPEVLGEPDAFPRNCSGEGGLGPPQEIARQGGQILEECLQFVSGRTADGRGDNDALSVKRGAPDPPSLASGQARRGLREPSRRSGGRRGSIRTAAKADGLPSRSLGVGWCARQDSNL